MKHVTIEQALAARTTFHDRHLDSMMERMSQFFGKIIDLGDDGSGFPRWGQSAGELMEVCWLLYYRQTLVHHPDGRPMTMRQIAEALCRNLHCPMPYNIYALASRRRRAGRKPVVCLYSRLWRENHTGLDSLLLWSEPVRFDPIRSYRGVFSSPAYDELQRAKRRARRTARDNH